MYNSLFIDILFSQRLLDKNATLWKLDSDFLNWKKSPCEKCDKMYSVFYFLTFCTIKEPLCWSDLVWVNEKKNEGKNE